MSEAVPGARDASGKAGRKVILFAPQVRSGGGLILLRALLAAAPKAHLKRAFLDSRSQLLLAAPPGVSIVWINPGPLPRLRAEWALHAAAREADIVLCFHGLPPLMPCSAQVLVYLQNRLLIDGSDLGALAPRTRMRLALERLVARWLRRRVNVYLVQTLGMARAVAAWNGVDVRAAPVRILPFADPTPGVGSRETRTKLWDFIYPAGADAHKNHPVLLEAWRILASDGIFPSLALTLPAGSLWHAIDMARGKEHLRVENLGPLGRDDMAAAYGSAGAVLFPSSAESLGLPLVEATELGIPIVAAELDYVRDVCTPAQTFDPRSPVSIARAVRRFLGATEEGVHIHTAAEVWQAIISVESDQ